MMMHINIQPIMYLNVKSIKYVAPRCKFSAKIDFTNRYLNNLTSLTSGEKKEDNYIVRGHKICNWNLRNLYYATKTVSEKKIRFNEIVFFFLTTYCVLS